MKTGFKFFCLSLLMLIFQACSDKHSGQSFPDKISSKTISDSIARLDSLVTSTKTINNSLAQKYARQALLFAEHVNSPVAMAHAYLLLGIAFYNFNIDSCPLYYTRSLALADQYHLDSLKQKIWYNLAMIHREAFDTKTAALYLDSVIFFSQKTKDWMSTSNAYNALGNLKFDVLDSANAQMMFDSAYNIAKRFSLPSQMGVAMASLAKFDKNRVTSAMRQRKAIEILKGQHGNEEEIALILINLGMQTTNPDSAIHYFWSAIQTGQSVNSTEVVIAAHNNLAYSFLDKQDIGQAELCINKYAIPLAKQVKNLDWLSTLYDTYTDVLLAKKDVAKALFFQREALKTRRQADQNQASDQVRLLSSLLDLKNKELMIQVKQREVEEKKKKIHIMSIGFFILLALLILIISAVVWKLQRNKIIYQKDLIVSQKRLLEMEEGIKGRIAMELHDLTTPFYTNMMQQIENAQIGDSKIVSDLKTRVSGMAGNIRQISHRMSNSFIEQLTLVELVRGLCKDLQEVSKVPIHCIVEEENFKLSSEETLHIYRMVQELLTNAIKYVTAGEVTISLSEEAGMLFILYQDTGPGFDQKKVNTRGLGLGNIYERAKIINGKAVLNTFPGKGTKWNISVPLQREKRKHHEKIAL